tara:strand:- start:358 stop:480 length:123 start_codon:yes stop_codon:yes gene_type:complete
MPTVGSGKKKKKFKYTKSGQKAAKKYAKKTGKKIKKTKRY